MRHEITPKNILMIGPTGVGKTEIARRVARLAHAPFVKVEATKFTEVVERREVRLMVFGLHLERGEHDPQPLFPDQFAQTVVIRQMVREGAQPADGLEGGAPQTQGLA